MEATPRLAASAAPSASTSSSEEAWDAAVEAVQRGDVGTLKRILASAIGGTISLDRRTVYQSCLIHLAARKGRAGMLAFLLECGADVHAEDYGSLRKTALHWAVIEGWIQCAELLVAKGATHQSALGMQHRTIFEFPKPSVDASEESNVFALAVRRPRWTTTLHATYPRKFRDAMRALVLVCHRFGLSVDVALEIAERAAYPIFEWTPQRVDPPDSFASLVI